MAVIINGTGQWDFDGDETVSITATFTLAGGDWIRKTDNIAQTILMSAGVIITVATTSFVSVSGQRPTTNELESGCVLFDSVAGDKVRDDWGYFAFTGTSTSNKMNWCIVKNCLIGIFFGGHHPTSGKFQYLIGINIGSTANGAILFDNSSSGATIIDDVVLIRSAMPKQTGAVAGTWSGVTIIDPLEDIFTQVTSNITINDCWIGPTYFNTNIQPVSGQTFTANRMYFNAPGRTQSNVNPVAGTAVMTGCRFEGTNIPFQNTGAGQVQWTDSDIVGGQNPSNDGLHGNNVNAFTLTRSALFGNRASDYSVFSDQIATPNDTSTISQYNNVQTITDPRSTPNFELEILTPTIDVSVVGQVTIACSSTMPARMTAYLYLNDQDRDKGQVIASDTTVPDVYVDGRIKVPCYVSDLGPEAGVKYGLNHEIVIPNLKGGDYRWDIKLEGIDDSTNELGQQAAVTIKSSVVAGGVNCVIE